MRDENKTAKPGYAPFRRRDTGYGIRDTMSTCGIVSESSQNRRKDEGTTLLFSLRGLGICLEEFVIFSKP